MPLFAKRSVRHPTSNPLAVLWQRQGLAFHSSPLSLQHGLSTTGKLLHEVLALLCFLCVSVCLSACIPVCQFMYVCIRTYVCTYVRMCLYDMCVCVYVCMNGEWMHACMMHAFVHLCMYPCHASMHPVIRVCMLYACCMHCVCIMHVVCIYVMHLCNAYVMHVCNACM